MYALQLPPTIPVAGTPGGPPLPEAYRNLGGVIGFDTQAFFLNLIRDPQQLQPTMDRMRAEWQASQKKK